VNNWDIMIDGTSFGIIAGSLNLMPVTLHQGVGTSTRAGVNFAGR
jgi:hypothetical protein